jgi:FHS family L-fucose permease-like MFS transporter
MGKATTEFQRKKRNYLVSLIIIGVLFFIFGFVTWLNGTLIPFLKIACELNDLQALFVTFAFYIAYFVMAPPSSIVLHKVGYKNGMSLGLFIMAIGSLIFIPAALSRTFWLFLAGLFVQGTGLALLQTASNPYIIIIGPMESAAKRIAIMGICNKIAGVISPLILSSIVLAGASTIVDNLTTLEGAARVEMLDNLANRVILPYVIIASVLFLLSIMIRFAHLPDIDTDKEEPSEDEEYTPKTAWWQFPHLILGFLALFFYVGAEVIAGDTIGLYGQSLRIPLDEAKFFTSLTLGSMVFGYILGILLIPRFIRQSQALAISAVLGILFTMGTVFSIGMTSIAFVALLGLANAMMWPTIFPLAIANLGKFTKAGSALLIMGIAGGATLPLLYGVIARNISNQQAYWILMPIYIFILFFAIKGHKLKEWKR